MPDASLVATSLVTRDDASALFADAANWTRSRELMLASSHHRTKSLAAAQPVVVCGIRRLPELSALCREASRHHGATRTELEVGGSDTFLARRAWRAGATPVMTVAPAVALSRDDLHHAGGVRAAREGQVSERGPDGQKDQPTRPRLQRLVIARHGETTRADRTEIRRVEQVGDVELHATERYLRTSEGLRRRPVRRMASLRLARCGRHVRRLSRRGRRGAERPDGDRAVRSAPPCLRDTRRSLNRSSRSPDR